MPKTTEKKSSKKDGSKKKTSKKATKPKKPAKAYCGIKNPIPKNYRLGSMEECLNAGKVNYYGLKKIDSRLVDVQNKELQLKATLKNTKNEFASILGKENKLKKLLDSAKTVEHLEKIKKEMSDIRSKKSKVIDKINELSKKK
jgi:hypothetical protein